eukprot:5129296-Prorocentrum_lima.AAC.1
MSAGEDETCMVYKMAMPRRQREEHQNPGRGDELGSNPDAQERHYHQTDAGQVMSPNSAGVGSPE